MGFLLWWMFSAAFFDPKAMMRVADSMSPATFRFFALVCLLPLVGWTAWALVSIYGWSGLWAMWQEAPWYLRISLGAAVAIPLWFKLSVWLFGQRPPEPKDMRGEGL